jgi:hypothetical protein
VDDGWQLSIGDWEANGKFPSGMNALAEKIKSTGAKGWAVARAVDRRRVVALISVNIPIGFLRE